MEAADSALLAARMQFSISISFHIVLAALTALVEQGRLEARVCQEAIERYDLQAERAASWNC